MSILKINTRVVLAGLGMNQSDLAKKMDVSPQYIGQILKDGNCGTEFLMKMCNALGCTPNDLLLKRA